ncbi:MAG TPA: 5'-3' exonuclease H3TH domain-containing protein [Steroidobacteraceae bacterium]|nr:5'-3' exonuclease H3TH domain-containing protein [Steroidobacteraceae bacterium]HNS28138.1 5'-3' exonuclease H3TH domain-containing protein [Steroidobacteraceae bacterium]
MIYLVDASVYVFRAYYSMPPDMADGDGNPTHALFGFARFLGDLIERARPEFLAVAFDESLTSSFRNRLYPPYKANRDPAPTDLLWQFARCREFCEIAGVRHLSSNEYEADDIIGTLAARARAGGLPFTVVTRDKDMAQLVREGDVYWDYAANERYRYHEIEGRFGVAPERFADWLALTGDSVDNIPGVPGVGPKTATALMREFASLDDLYAGLERVADLPIRGASKLAEKLRRHRDAAYLARRLTGIACDMPLDLDHAALRPRAPDIAALNAFCDRLGFGPMLRRQAERLAALAPGSG